MRRRIHWPTMFGAWLVSGALSAVMMFALHAPYWLVLVASFALGLAWPSVLRQPDLTLCHMCERGLHPHEYPTGECIANYCECPVREPVTDGETR